MKHFLLFTLLVLFQNTCSSQYYREKDRFKLGAHAGVEFGYRFLMNGNTENYKIDDIIKQRNLSERPRLLNTYGVSFSYQMNKIFTLDLGVEYSEKGLASIRLGNTSDFSIGTRENYLFYKHRFGYFQLPISTKLYFLNRPKVSVFTRLGVQLEFLFFGEWKSRYKSIGSEEMTVYQYEKGSELKADNFNTFNFGSLLSLGCDYRITRRSSIGMEFLLRNSLIELKKAQLKEYLYNFGMQVSYIYSFRSKR